jgi:hypothetical protein
MTVTTVTLPVPHADQRRACDTFQWFAPDGGIRFSIVRCGRRWGKTELLGAIGCTDAILGKLVGYFAPDYKRMLPFYKFVAKKLEPIKVTSSQQSGMITTVGGGAIEHWTLNDPNAGRSRKYHTVLIDEAAFAGADMLDVWRNSIKPTLLDYRGRCIVASNTSGIDQDQWFWKICNEPEHGFIEFHAPSSGNPYLAAEDLEELEKNEHPLVWEQEYLAKFVDWSGIAFFNIDLMLVDGKPIELPKRTDQVFATIDTATKTGTEHDGSAVVYWARNTIGDGPPLTLLDWDIIQVEGSLLETWLPTVFQNCEAYARECRARLGFVGAWIEDKASGMVLLQHANRNEWPAHAIESEMTAVGKDGRALSVSGYFQRQMVKMAERAYHKVVTYKGASRNHLRTQIASFRMGDKDPRREDDLLDCFCYGIAISLGNQEGF